MMPSQSPKSWKHAGVMSKMKISDVESGKAVAHLGAAEAKILPKDRPRTSARSGAEPARQLSPTRRVLLS